MIADAITSIKAMTDNSITLELDPDKLSEYVEQVSHCSLNMMPMVPKEYCKRLGQVTLNSDGSSEDSQLSLVQSLMNFM